MCNIPNNKDLPRIVPPLYPSPGPSSASSSTASDHIQYFGKYLKSERAVDLPAGLRRGLRDQSVLRKVDRREDSQEVSSVETCSVGRVCGACAVSKPEVCLCV